MPRKYNLRDKSTGKYGEETRTNYRSSRTSAHSRISSSESDSSEEEDEANWSYPSTQNSPSAVTPSPSQLNVKVYQSDDTDDYTPPKSRLYPDLPGVLYESAPSPEHVGVDTPSPKHVGRKTQSAGIRRSRTLLSPDSANDRKEIHVENHDMWWIIGAAVIVVFISCYLMFPGSSAQTNYRTEPYKQFISQVNDLQRNFQLQEVRTWRSIKSAVKHVLNSTDPEYPAVVLFAVEKSNALIASCLARQVATMFNMVTKEIRYDGYLDMRSLSHLEAPQQKQVLDNKIHEYFKYGRSVVIDHLEALSPEATLLLHGICDNDNAPFKNAFIGIVFNVDRKISASGVDAELTRYLSTSLDMDKIGALLTRINNNGVVINFEQIEHLSDICV